MVTSLYYSTAGREDGSGFILQKAGLLGALSQDVFVAFVVFRLGIIMGGIA